MGAVHVPEPRQYDGAFKWRKVHPMIKETKPDYDINDRRTWTLVTLIHLKHHLGHANLPPEGLVYSKEAMEALHKAQPAQKRCVESPHAVEGKKTYCYGFLMWPFNYASNGSLRERIGIPKAEFELWMSRKGRPHTKAIQERRMETTYDGAKRKDDTLSIGDSAGVNCVPRIQNTPRTQDT
jgi:hypothetical protein